MPHAAESQSDPQRRRPAVNRITQPTSVAPFIDNHPDAVARRTLADAIHNSPYMVTQRKQLRSMFSEAAQLTGGLEDEAQQFEFVPRSDRRQFRKLTFSKCSRIRARVASGSG